MYWLTHVVKQNNTHETPSRKSGDHSWKLWKQILKTLTPSSKTTTNRLTKRLGKWIEAHSECGKWLSYQDRNRNFYTRETQEDNLNSYSSKGNDV